MIGFFGVQNGLNLAPYLTPKKYPIFLTSKSSFVRGWPRRPKSAFARCLDGSENRVILELKFRVQKSVTFYTIFLGSKKAQKRLVFFL